MTTVIIYLGGGKYRVKTDLDWSIMPSNRKVDVLSTAVKDSDWYTDGGEYGRQTWTIDDPFTGKETDHANYTSASNKWERQSNAYGVAMNLKNDEYTGRYNRRVERLDLYMYYTVTPRNSPSRIDAFGDYAHQETSISVTPSISWSGVSLSVSPSSKFTYQSNTQASLSF